MSCSELAAEVKAAIVSTSSTNTLRISLAIFKHDSELIHYRLLKKEQA
jgi:hypothetical protein